jgi:hypothetical protein
MVTFVIESDQVSVPEWVTDLNSFRRWADSEDFPETGRICYLNGEVWVDMSKEQIFTHIDVKSEIVAVLRPLVKTERLGVLLGDGVFLSNVDVNFAVVPDAVFVSKVGSEAMSKWKVHPTWCWKWLATVPFTRIRINSASITGKPASANTG